MTKDDFKDDCSELYNIILCSCLKFKKGFGSVISDCDKLRLKYLKSWLLIYTCLVDHLLLTLYVYKKPWRIFCPNVNLVAIIYVIVEEVHNSKQSS